MTREGKFAALEWKAYLRAARADHTRNLSRPWYVSEDSGENGIRARWQRQALRYAEWYVAHVLGIDGRVRSVDHVGTGSEVYVAACVVCDGRFQTVELPSHLWSAP